MHLRHDVFDVEHDVFTVDVFIVPPFCLSSWLLQTSWSLIVNNAFETGGFRCAWHFQHLRLDLRGRCGTFCGRCDTFCSSIDVSGSLAMNSAFETGGFRC